jgi:hypothetical protein
MPRLRRRHRSLQRLSRLRIVYRVDRLIVVALVSRCDRYSPTNRRRTANALQVSGLGG